MSNTTSTPIDINAELARLQAENAALKAKDAKRSTLTMKVGEKGGMCLYGLGRFPVSLYIQQWERLLGHAEEIKGFLEANRASLKVKE